MTPILTNKTSLMDFVLKYFNTHDIPPEVELLFDKYIEAYVKFDRNMISIEEYVQVLTSTISKLRVNKICKALINQYQADINLILAEDNH